jgi:ferric-dicitrate binding protein FerR (iron transport regulator)
MNPDKLFDYLDGKLPDHERQALEERLMSDASVRREFDVARRIHAGMRENQSDRPEILSEMSEETAARGRRMARQVGLAFIVLVAMNVLLGLVYIAHHESKKPESAIAGQTGARGSPTISRKNGRRYSDPATAWG